MTLWYAVVCSLGVAANTLAYLSLRRTPPSTPGRTLLRHQCFLDAALCVAGFVLLTQPQWWHSGLPVLDAILCRLWHSEFLFFCHSNVSLSILLLCVLDHLTLVPKDESDTDRRSELWYLIAVYGVGYLSAAPDLATVTFEESKCFSRMSLPPGVDAVLCAAAVTTQLVPFVFVWLFLRRLCVLGSSLSLINRKQTRQVTIYIFTLLVPPLGVGIMVYLVLLLGFMSAYSDKEIMLALILSRSVFSTPGLVWSKIVSAETDSSAQALLVKSPATTEEA
ncbi:hypothetical protein NP493_138g05007 [Ridgeia piscesae]|uniref:G-protein coupled receptors family 1 profile domain-containing protein n=1 Tax=Ridgeia piscesae TaxID=27915 RepID=A0AAD9UGA3_RIDPI|nr:hypothetical protein NP493_138g05007 [Ridgeia piscesae]